MFLCTNCKRFKITCNCNRTNCKCDNSDCECGILVVVNLSLFFLESKQHHKIDKKVYQIVSVLSEDETADEKFIVVERGKSLFPPLACHELKQKLYDLAEHEWEIGEYFMSSTGMRWIKSYHFQLQKDGYTQEVDEWEKDLVISIEKYKNEVELGNFTDHDGHGHPVIDGKVNRNMILLPSDKFDRIKDKVTHIIWYSK